LNESILGLIARVIEWCEPTRDNGPGHPPTETVRVLAALRRFLREGTPWRSLRATEAQASGSTLRRRLADWARTGVLRHVHSMLVGMGSMQNRGVLTWSGWVPRSWNEGRLMRRLASRCDHPTILHALTVLAEQPHCKYSGRGISWRATVRR